jgi:hypothetical protein
MEIIDLPHDPKLKTFAQRLEALMKRAHGDKEREPLNYLLGALHGLLQAKRLGFKDRDHALDDARGRSPKGVEYWEYGPLARVRLMSEGKLRVDGAWVAGFYFNSSLARVAAAFDRAVRRKAIQKGLDVEDPRPPGSPPPPKVWKLLRGLGLDRFTRGKLEDVHKEANALKHRAAGLGKRRNVTMADATAAFEQMLDLLEHPAMR